MGKISLLHLTKVNTLGIRKFLLDLIKYTDREKFDISVACPSDGPLEDDLKRIGIKVKIIEMEREIKPLSDIKSFLDIVSYIRKEKFDIVHTHCSKAGFLGRVAARLLGVKGIIYTPNSWFFDEPMSIIKRKFYIFLEKFAAYFGDIIVAVTKEERTAVIQKKITKPDKIVTIYDGIDFSDLDTPVDNSYIFREFGISETTPIVGMIARLVPQKAPEDYVFAAAKVIQHIPKVRFFLIGDGILRKRVESLIDRLQIRDNFCLTGYRDDIKEFLSILDIVVLTSRYEGLPLILLQAMAIRKPVVITRIKGINEVIDDGKNGIIVPIGDISAISNSIIYLLEHEDMAAIIGRNARKPVERKFTALQMAKKYEKLYCKLMSRR